MAKSTITDEDRDLILQGIRPKGYTHKQYSNARARLKYKYPNMAPTKQEYYKGRPCPTDAEKELCLMNVKPAGWTKSKMHSFVTRLRKKGEKPDTSPHEFRKWTPEEDLMIIDGDREEYPSYVSIRECERRRNWLKENFVDCGWAAIIGTKTIYEEGTYKGKEDDS